jgi:hypothetical protein
VHIPYWLTLGVALIVCVFGAYRIRIAFRDEASQKRAKDRGGLYSMGRRTHLLVGLVYLLLGGALVATTFGWNPMGGMFGPTVDAPKKGAEPTTGGVPVDEIQPATPKK